VTYEDLISTFGGCTAAAKALGLRKQTVNKWQRAGIPFDQQFRIQMKTRGRLKADLSLLDLAEKKRVA
jgi:hypothetical protein